MPWFIFTVIRVCWVVFAEEYRNQPTTVDQNSGELANRTRQKHLEFTSYDVR